MKQTVSLFLVILVFSFLINTNVHASEGLSQEEKNLLINKVGLSEDDLDILSAEDLRLLIEEDAEVVLENTEEVSFLETTSIGRGATTYGTISAKKLKLTGK